MFDDWKQAWREAVENFRREAAGDDGGPPRVRAMERELASATGALARLDDEISRTVRERDQEVDAALVCRRREQLARDAGDDETVRIAIEFGARHDQRAAVLERKIAVLQDEHALLDREVTEMRGMIATASEAAQAAAASGSPAAAVGGSFDHERDEQDRTFSRLEREARERAAEARLAELKRRMQG